MKDKVTQAERVFDYMVEFDGITQLEALRDLGVMRLASRISDLRKRGIPIEATVVGVQNRFGETCYIKRYRVKVSETNG